MLLCFFLFCSGVWIVRLVAKSGADNATIATSSPIVVAVSSDIRLKLDGQFGALMTLGKTKQRKRAKLDTITPTIDARFDNVESKCFVVDSTTNTISASVRVGDEPLNVEVDTDATSRGVVRPICTIKIKVI